MKTSILYIAIGLISLQLISIDLVAQKAEGDKASRAYKERMEVDAFAMAYQFCEFSLDIENAKADPKSKRLLLKSKESQKQYIGIDTTMQQRYKNDFDKFKDLFDDGQKKFKVCADLQLLKDQRKKKQEAERLLREKQRKTK